MKREPNEYVQGGRYLIEHRPIEPRTLKDYETADEPRGEWAVCDLKLIFSNNHGCFFCWTKTEATVLRAKLAELEHRIS